MLPEKSLMVRMADWNRSNLDWIAGAKDSSQDSSVRICSGFWLTKSNFLIEMKLGKIMRIGRGEGKVSVLIGFKSHLTMQK